MEIIKKNNNNKKNKKKKTKKQKAEREKNNRYVSISLNNRIEQGQLYIQGGWFTDDITKKWASFTEINVLNTLD